MASALTLVLILLQVSISLYYLHSLRGHLLEITTRHNLKVDTVQQMAKIIRERSLRLHAMYFVEDTFQRDDEYMRFLELAGEFIHLRESLVQYGLTMEEEAELSKALLIIRTTEPLQNELAEKLSRNEIEGIREEIGSEDLPLENRLLSLFDRFVELVREESRDAAGRAEQDYQSATRLLSIAAIISIFGVWFITYHVLRRITSIETHLHEEKERANITLDNIMDGVIKTDLSGLITDMNPSAQRMTGYSRADAHGKHLDTVYHLSHASSQTYVHAAELPSNIDGAFMRCGHQYRLHSRTEGSYIIEETISPIFDRTGRISELEYIFSDVSYARNQVQRANEEALVDPLTRLYNRLYLEKRLNKDLDERNTSRRESILLYIDLDRFKSINDNYGHKAGDLLLQGIAREMESCVRDGDIVARIGGDEFVVLLVNCPYERGKKIAEEILKRISAYQFLYKGHRIMSGGSSIGMKYCGQGTTDWVAMIEHADSACYAAKNKGRNVIIDLDDVVQTQ